MLEVTWSTGDDHVLRLVGPQLICLLDSERVIEQKIRVEALRALSCALLRATQVWTYCWPWLCICVATWMMMQLSSPSSQRLQFLSFSCCSDDCKWN